MSIVQQGFLVLTDFSHAAFWNALSQLYPSTHNLDSINYIASTAKVVATCSCRQGFALDRLKDCEVYILDHTSQLTVDDCINCRIFIGPCDGSIFVRDCTDCVMCVATRQFRTRDCKNLDASLYCPTNPSIETSTGVTFSRWRGAYPGAVSHFVAAKLDPGDDTWDQIYDFNAGEEVNGSSDQHWGVDRSARAPWIAPALPPDLLAHLEPPLPEAAQAVAAGPPENPVPGGADESLPPEPVAKAETALFRQPALPPRATPAAAASRAAAAGAGAAATPPVPSTPPAAPTPAAPTTPPAAATSPPHLPATPASVGEAGAREQSVALHGTGGQEQQQDSPSPRGGRLRVAAAVSSAPPTPTDDERQQSGTSTGGSKAVQQGPGAGGGGPGGRQWDMEIDLGDEEVEEQTGPAATGTSTATAATAGPAKTAAPAIPGTGTAVPAVSGTTTPGTLPPVLGPAMASMVEHLSNGTPPPPSSSPAMTGGGGGVFPAMVAAVASTTAVGASTGGGDARETWRAANSARLAQQGEKEKEARAQLKEKAAQVLKERAQKRQEKVQARRTQLLGSEKQQPGGGQPIEAVGAGQGWAGVLGMLSSTVPPLMAGTAGATAAGGGRGGQQHATGAGSSAGSTRAGSALSGAASSYSSGNGFVGGKDRSRMRQVIERLAAAGGSTPGSRK